MHQPAGWQLPVEPGRAELPEMGSFRLASERADVVAKLVSRNVKAGSNKASKTLRVLLRQVRRVGIPLRLRPTQVPHRSTCTPITEAFPGGTWQAGPPQH